MYKRQGLTSGEVLALGASLQVQLSDTDYGVFSDQIVCKMPAKGGDSGSLVLDQNRRAVGLLFAGSEQCTVFNRIDPVSYTHLDVYKRQVYNNSGDQAGN